MSARPPNCVCPRIFPCSCPPACSCSAPDYHDQHCPQHGEATMGDTIAELHQELCNIAFDPDMNTMLTEGYYAHAGQKHYPTNDERAEMFAEALREVRAALYTERWADLIVSGDSPPEQVGPWTR